MLKELFLSVKDQTANSSGFGSHTISVTTAQLCLWRTKAVIGNMQRNGHVCVPIKLYYQNQVADWIWSVAIVCQSMPDLEEALIFKKKAGGKKDDEKIRDLML